MESNKEARRILNRHGVDLAYCQYSCVGNEVHLSGWLCKHDGSDFNGPQIQSLINDIQRLLHGFSVSGNCDNWKFTSDSISYVGEREDRKQGSGGSAGEQVTYEIELDDYDFEAS